MVATQETRNKIDSFNSSHHIGDLVAYQESEKNLRITRLKSLAFAAGRGGAPFVKLEIGRGNFSIDKIRNASEASNRKRNVFKPRHQKLKEHNGIAQLKNHIEKELNEKHFSVVNKVSICQLFPPIKQRWGNIDETKQFQIWLKDKGYKITAYSKNFYKIEKCK